MTARSPLRLGVATWSGRPDAVDDDRRLLEALPDSVEPLVAAWDDLSAPWASCDAVLIRSCWDYHTRVEEFVGWASALEARGTALWNPASVVAWNARKTYLRHLAEAGLPTVPTVWLEGADVGAYQRLIEESPWRQVVLKPIVGASSYLTWSGSAAEAAAERDLVTRLAAHGGAMLQPFVREVQERGEWSLMYFEGRFSHAVLKQARAGEFRVQEEFGGTTTALPAPAALCAIGEAALRVTPAPALYARIDGIETASGFQLSEVELIEPMLFLDSAEQAATRFAAALIERLGNLRRLGRRALEHRNRIGEP